MPIDDVMPRLNARLVPLLPDTRPFRTAWRRDNLKSSASHILECDPSHKIQVWRFVKACYPSQLGDHRYSYYGHS